MPLLLLTFDPFAYCPECGKHYDEAGYCGEYDCCFDCEPDVDFDPYDTPSGEPLTL